MWDTTYRHHRTTTQSHVRMDTRELPTTYPDGLSGGTGRVTERDGWDRPESDGNTIRDLGGCRPS